MKFSTDFSAFAKYAWGTLIFNIAVILWGAYVRATGSGAGCGAHWPTCQGEVLPRAPQIETLVELSHRVTSGLAFLLVVAMLIWAYRAFPKKHPVRLGATLSMVLMVTEALVGAGLVLFELVAYNESVARVYAVSTHLVNTFLLLAALTLTAWWASGGKRISLKPMRPAGWATLVGMLAVLVLGVTGAITALGDTLFPAGSLAEGIAQDFEPTAHFLIRLRVWHPVIAIFTGVYLLVLAQYLLGNAENSVRTAARVLLGVFVAQLVIGGVNLVLLVPVWSQMLHLLAADSVWVVLVILGALIQQSPEEVT